MASIYKRKNKYCVVYRYNDANGKEHQKWETFDTNSEARKRKTEIEYQQQEGNFTVYEAKTVSDLLNDYVSIYGVNKWAMSTYEGRKSLIAHYINPVIGNLELKKINTRIIEKYYLDLLEMKNVSSFKSPDKPVSSNIIREIHKLLRCAFNQAIKWDLIAKNPCLNATVPKAATKTRNIWDAETLFKAISVCDDEILKLALNLAFSCSLRIGEMLGLTWDCIDISDKSISSNDAYIIVNKELQRVNKDTMEKLGEKDIIKKFPAIFCRNTTVLVLKTPKTASSIRKVFLPKTVALMLKKRYNDIQELIDLFGEEYYDYNLVFCSPNGRPMESQIITRALQKLIKENNLPNIVFHSLRHSSITYKLKLNSGDIKAVQGDSGHSQVKMITDVYSHILDEDRKYNAIKFENAFYSNQSSSYSGKKSNEENPLPSNNSTENDVEVLLELIQNPEMKDLIKMLASSLK